jgi:hypothetical protein
MFSLHISAERKTAMQKNIMSITRSSITVPSIDDRDIFSHLPTSTERVISPSRGTTQFTPYPIINEPNKFLNDVSFFTELNITFHRSALNK